MAKLKLLSISILCLVAGIYTLPMWALKCIGITLALCGALAAYLVHLANTTEIPEGVTQPDIVKQILISSKILRNVVSVICIRRLRRVHLKICATILKPHMYLKHRC